MFGTPYRGVFLDFVGDGRNAETKSAELNFSARALTVPRDKPRDLGVLVVVGVLIGCIGVLLG